MELFEKARELAAMITQSQEFMTLKLAEEDMIMNAEAITLLNDFGKLRQAYAEALSENTDDATLEAMKDEFLQKNNALFENPLTKNYIEAKQKIDEIFKTIADILQSAVNPNEEHEGGCGTGGCSSCNCGCG